MRTQSETLFADACTVLPGGVSSPVRAFGSVGGSPIFIEKGEGPYVVDVDGHRYIDYVLSWGPLIHGHAHPQVTAKIMEQAQRGTSFGAPSSLETVLAKEIIHRVPSIEMVRFVSSGTEATMSAIRLARAHTGRNKIIKFDGCYHGHADSFLVSAGSGVATFGLPNSPGVSHDVTQNTVSIPYNSVQALQQVFEANGSEIAAVIVEPIAGNMGLVAPTKAWLQQMRSLCDTYGTLLIFDEVMSGFRVGYTSAQGLVGVMPDITCLGKVV
ncbi:MAG: glutamate-1-semialdehyde 2,1-aminomutase, partial [Bacilli bacterium]